MAKEALQKAQLFRGLTEKELQGLLAIAREIRLGAGEFVFSEGDKGDGLYLVLEGTVEVNKARREGGAHALAAVPEGGVLGEMSLLGETKARSASAVAQGAVKLLKFPSEKFAQLLDSADLGALKVAVNLARVLSKRLWAMDDKLVELVDKGQRREELVNFQKILTDWSF
jgi:CRP-like cAMP-binding protein